MSGEGSTGGNSEQAALWNGPAGEIWAQQARRLDRELSALGLLALDALSLAPGERVLDVGCGSGSTTAEAARRVSPGGHAAGIDISAVQLRQARAAGYPGCTFQEADAQVTTADGGPFDAIFSRFGVMFFADPVAAFARLHAACAPDGRMAFVCWQPAAANPWNSVCLHALEGLDGAQIPPPVPGPGMFAFADADQTAAMLAAAGWQYVDITGHTRYLVLDEPELSERIAFARASGLTAPILAALPGHLQAEADRRMHAAWQRYAVDGSYAVPRAIWLVTAVR